MATIGIVIFEDAEELDYVGPWEVFTVAAMLGGRDKVTLVAEREGAVRSAKGMRVLPDHTFETAPPLDVVVVPGGQGTRREVKNPAMIRWLKSVSERSAWLASVCTGALLWHEAGPARGRKVTTHWSFVGQLRSRGDVTVLDDVRFVRDGNLVTAAGVSAGIDMALWLVGQLHDPAFARKVQRYIEYHPAPPYTAEC
jgi:transcriptional regulator GlxA family with amidase domain